MPISKHLLLFLSIFSISLDLGSTGDCTKNRLVLRGHVTGSSALTTILDHLASQYADARRIYGINVQTEYTRFDDPNGLFSIPSQFAWANVNEFVFPILARALVMVINLPNVKQLDMPFEVIADIYKGQITMWNDPIIAMYNPKAALPAQPIIALARQEEFESSTTLFTNMLSRMDDEWAAKYGVIRGPDFLNGVCCVSQKWKNVVKYFPQDIVGVVGMIISMPYTIGYASRPEIEGYNVTRVSLLENNRSRTAVEPNLDTLQLPMMDYVNNTPVAQALENGTIYVTRDNMKAPGAYPMTAISYLTLKLDYRSKFINDCCLIQEMVGFLEFLLLPTDPSMFTNSYYVSVPPSMANMIIENVLRRVKCDDRSMYQEYQTSKHEMITSAVVLTQAGPAQTVFIVISTLLVVAAILVSIIYTYKRVQKRRGNANLYMIESNRLKVPTLGTNAAATNGHDQHHHEKGEGDDVVSYSGSKRTGGPHTVLSREMLFLKNTFPTGDLDENTKVSLAELPLARSQKSGHLDKVYTINQWNEKTRSLAVKMRKSASGNRNLAAFIGLVELNDSKLFTVFEYCAKGTLHYNLATCRYRLTDSIRRYLAVDVASGLEYLHTKVGVVHGQLNSLTCFLDMAWTVKIVLWDQTALHYSEAIRYGGTGDKAFYTHDGRWRCRSEDVKRLILGENGLEALTRLIYVDPQMTTTYPQPAVDVYSFGILLAEIFTGKLPYYEELIGGVLGVDPTTMTGNELAATPDALNKQLSSYLNLLEKKFTDPGTMKLPTMPKSTPKYVLNIIEASMRADATKRPTIKTILRHLSVSACDVNKGGLVDAMMETMDTYAEQLEEKVEERTAELKLVTTKMRDLLNEVLPPQIAEKLFNGEVVPPEYFECVSVYFSDIVGFTVISAKSTPIQVMSFLNDLWLCFDSIIQDFDVYKVDTIGDAYMVCSGLPNRNGVAHCRQIAKLSLALLEACKKFKVCHLPDEKLHIRIGLNTGPVTAGVVGLKMPQYCVFGDTVNTAARMESTSLPGRIQISSSTYMMLVEHYPGEFSYEYRGEITVKGKGNMLTYWLITGEEAAKRSKSSALSTRL